jgi:hypothetical protein
MNNKMLFRRNTHDRAGNYKEEFNDQNLSEFQKHVWEECGNIVHMLFSSRAISYNDLLQEIRKDTTNFFYGIDDLGFGYDCCELPDPRDVALSLVLLIEAGFVEVCDE